MWPLSFSTSLSHESSPCCQCPEAAWGWSAPSAGRHRQTAALRRPRGPRLRSTVWPEAAWRTYRSGFSVEEDAAVNVQHKNTFTQVRVQEIYDLFLLHKRICFYERTWTHRVCFHCDWRLKIFQVIDPRHFTHEPTRADSKQQTGPLPGHHVLKPDFCLRVLWEPEHLVDQWEREASSSGSALSSDWRL